MRKNSESIIVEQTFIASIDIVWNSITEIDQMVTVYFPEIYSDIIEYSEEW